MHAASLSTIVKTALLGEPRIAPPVGEVKEILTVSFDSAELSFVIGMTNVSLVSPERNVSVPLADV